MSDEQNPSPEEQTPDNEEVSTEGFSVLFFNLYSEEPVDNVPIGTTIAGFLESKNIATGNFLKRYGQQGTGLLQLLHNDTTVFEPAFESQVLIDGDKLKILPASQKGG